MNLFLLLLNYQNNLDNLLLKYDFPDPDGPVITIVFIISFIVIYYI